MFKEEAIDAGQKISYFVGGKYVGCVIIKDTLTTLRIQWIEVIEKERFKGFASNLFDYVLTMKLNNDQTLQFTAVNEDAYNFFACFFLKRNVNKSVIWKWSKETDAGFKFTIPKEDLDYYFSLGKENATTVRLT